MSEQYDLVVIGAGSGGVRASRMAAATGARVAVIEDMFLGGTCVNAGCVPKKLFVYASQFKGHIEHASGFGVDASFNGFDWPTLKSNKDNEINRLNGIYENILEGPGVEIIRGRGTVAGPGKVEVNGKILETKRILIATGGWPFKPDIPGGDLAMDSNDVFAMDTLPKRIVVVGGGYIAVEFAGIFNGLGCDTQLLYRGDQILRGFDNEVRRFVTQEVAKAGVKIRTQTDVERIEEDGDEKICHLSDGSTLRCDLVMMATGRKAKTSNLGLEEAGVELRKNGSIVANERFETSVPGIFALGDVIDTPALTPVALEQGMIFVDQQFGEGKRTLNYELIPTAVFCQPNIGTVGVSEEEAGERYPGDIDVYTSEFRALKHTLSGSSERTLMKLVVKRSEDRILGAHMVGDEAGEIIQGIAIAMQAGATKSQFDATLGIHPTGAEEFVTMRSVTREL